MVEPVVATNEDLTKLFFECKEYVVAICQGGACTDKLDDLCQVNLVQMPGNLIILIDLKEYFDNKSKRHVDMKHHDH